MHTSPGPSFFENEEGCWLADGWHRHGGAERAGLTEIEVIRHPGGLRDAILFALGANAKNGMRLTNAEKRHAVTVALNDPEWSQWSNMEIARRCGVDEKLIRRMRSDLADSDTSAEPKDGGQPTGRTFIHPKTGLATTMDVSRIGRDRDIEDRPGPVVEEPYRITPAPDLIVAYAEIVRERETAQQAAQAERPVASSRRSNAGNQPGVTATVAHDLGLGKATVKRAGALSPSS